MEAAKTKFTRGYKGLNPSKITTTVGQNVGGITYAGIKLSFWDLGGQEELQPLWEKVCQFVLHCRWSFAYHFISYSLEKVWIVCEISILEIFFYFCFLTWYASCHMRIYFVVYNCFYVGVISANLLQWINMCFIQMSHILVSYYRIRIFLLCTLYILLWSCSVHIDMRFRRITAFVLCQWNKVFIVPKKQQYDWSIWVEYNRTILSIITYYINSHQNCI